jgi:hypothetical protein
VKLSRTLAERGTFRVAFHDGLHDVGEAQTGLTLGGDDGFDRKGGAELRVLGGKLLQFFSGKSPFAPEID